MHATADEELVEVLLASRSGVKDRLFPEVAQQFIEMSFKLLSGKHVIRRIPHHAIEACRAFLDLVLVPDLPLVGVDEAEEHFGELDLPMEETPVGTLRQPFDLRDQSPFLV